MKIGEALNPSPTLLCKLGSIVVHLDELNSADGHPYDRAALDQLMGDSEVLEWREAMNMGGFLPVMRKPK